MNKRWVSCLFVKTYRYIYIKDDAFENEVAMSLQMLQVKRNIQIYELTRYETMA